MVTSDPSNGVYGNFSVVTDGTGVRQVVSKIVFIYSLEIQTEI